MVVERCPARVVTAQLEQNSTTIHHRLFTPCPVHATARGEEEASAQHLVLNGRGRFVQLARAAERALLAFEPLVVRLPEARALVADGLRVNAELDVCDERLTEQRVQSEQKLRTHLFELLAPSRVGHTDDERLAVEAEGDGAAAQRL